MSKIQLLGFEDYNNYLSSRKWQERKIAYKENHPEKCFVCNGLENNCNLHHISYDHVGYELDSDLIWLCEKHHHEIHQVKQGKPSIQEPNKNAHIELKQAFLSGKTYKVKDKKKRSKKHKKLTITKQWRGNRSV